MTWNWDAVENCIDCNGYDDTSQADTFLYDFGDYWSRWSDRATRDSVQRYGK